MAAPQATTPASQISAVILAAGVGRRLGEDAPKALLAFGGKTLLQRHIEALHINGIIDISITVGHCADLLRGELARIGADAGITLVENPRYREGSIVSLWTQCARLNAGGTVLLMDADVLYDRRMIARLLAATSENVLLLDRAIEPGDEPVKICLRDNVIVDFDKKPDRPYDAHGESVGFFRFSPAGAVELGARVAAYVDSGRGNAEYELAIRDLIHAHPDRFGYEDVSDLPWTEIDFPADVVRARRDILPQLQEVEHA